MCTTLYTSQFFDKKKIILYVFLPIQKCYFDTKFIELSRIFFILFFTNNEKFLFWSEIYAILKLKIFVYFYSSKIFIF